MSRPEPTTGTGRSASARLSMPQSPQPPGPVIRRCRRARPACRSSARSMRNSMPSSSTTTSSASISAGARTMPSDKLKPMAKSVEIGRGRHHDREGGAAVGQGDRGLFRNGPRARRHGAVAPDQALNRNNRGRNRRHERRPAPPRSERQSSRCTRSMRSCRSCASIDMVAMGRASSRRMPIGSPVSSQ